LAQTFWPEHFGPNILARPLRPREPSKRTSLTTFAQGLARTARTTGLAALMLAPPAFGTTEAQASAIQLRDGNGGKLFNGGPGHVNLSIRVNGVGQSVAAGVFQLNGNTHNVRNQANAYLNRANWDAPEQIGVILRAGNQDLIIQLPEPGAVALFAAALLGLGLVARRRLGTAQARG
jgi:hypothetical protein